VNDLTANTPTLSIITVCRNSAATIAKTIECVLVQKNSGDEYLIIDGASTDGTQDIVSSFQGIDYVISEPDTGIADAFNKGLCRVTGQIVGIINADDQLCSSALARVRSYFSDNPNVDVIHGDVLLYEGSLFIKRIKPAGRWWYPWRLVLFNHPATFVRREVYEKWGHFDDSYAIAMDVEIFLRWMRKGVTIAYLPETLVAMQAGGVSGRSALKGYREVKRALSVHGYSALLVNLQYVARFGLQLVVMTQGKLRKIGWVK
jgi:glycosyltransferase involved in cell wall biosynthesis